MNGRIIAIKAEVECADGTTHQDVKIAFDGTSRIFIKSDGAKLDAVKEIKQCVVIIPSIRYAEITRHCKECES